ncbi:F-box-like protein [Ceratobasidium sp. AG-Ba]|nr:F-box-like protein [Ceratobasidium sp. AG-Ba]
MGSVNDSETSPTEPLDLAQLSTDELLDYMASTRTRISRDIRSYLSSCLFLASNPAQSRDSVPHQQSQIPSTIAFELSSIEEEIDNIDRIRQILIDARNKARMTAPVYSLPVELLTRIFQETTCHNGHDKTQWPCRHHSSPVVLSAVCNLWRETAMKCRPLWAHLDILVGSASLKTYYPSSQLWTRCLQGNTLQLHVRQSDFPVVRSTNPFDQSNPYEEEDYASDSSNDIVHAQMRQKSSFFRDEISNLVDFLEPLMEQVDHIEIIASQELENLFILVSRLIVDFPARSTLPKQLRLIYSGVHRVHRFQPMPSRQSSQSQVIKRYFNSLTKLELRNTWVNWHNLSRLANLVELTLEKPSVTTIWPITQDQLAVTLASCPKLRSLMLLDIEIRPHQLPENPQPVVLHDLRVLSFRSMAWGRRMELAMALITPGSHSLHMSIELPQDYEDSFIKELQMFISRSNVTILNARAVSFDAWFASQVGVLPSVHTLALHACILSNPSDASHNANLNNPPDVLWPRLRELHLISCRVEQGYLHRLLSRHNVETLYLHRCYDENVAGDKYDTHDTAAYQEEFKALLEDCVANVIALPPRAKNETADWLFVGSPV